MESRRTSSSGEKGWTAGKGGGVRRKRARRNVLLNVVKLQISPRADGRGRCFKTGKKTFCRAALSLTYHNFLSYRFCALKHHVVKIIQTIKSFSVEWEVSPVTQSFERFIIIKVQSELVKMIKGIRKIRNLELRDTTDTIWSSQKK